VVNFLTENEPFIKNAMSRNNRDDFNQCAALVFNLLYKNFPIEIDFKADLFRGLILQKT
jgi:hypothetical protein